MQTSYGLEIADSIENDTAFLSLESISTELWLFFSVCNDCTSMTRLSAWAMER